MRYLATRLPAALVTFFLGVAANGLLSSDTDFKTYDAPSDPCAAREVMRAEAEYLRANNERDVAALSLVLADDLRAGGRLRTKERRLAFVSSPALESLSVTTDGVRVHAAGGEAWVTGRAVMRGRYAGRDFGGWEYGFTRHYERRGGAWQVVSMDFACCR